MNRNSYQRRLRGVLAVCLFSPLAAWAQVLEVNLTGLQGELQDNVRAWLGAPPETAQARANYLHTVEDKVAGSLQALGYYRPDIQMTLERVEPRWQLAIHVDPGEPVHLRTVDIRIGGEAGEDPAFAPLLSEPGLAPGDVLNHQLYETLRRQITALGQQQGYFDGHFTERRVEVEPVGGTADVFLHYASGQRYRFGELHYDSGRLDPSLIKPLLAFREGDLYAQQLLRDSQAQLQRTGYFSTVILRPQLDAAAGGVVPMQLQLEPARRHSFNVGVGYSTDTEERVTLVWRTPQLNSHGHSQETRLQYSRVNPSGRFTYTIPLTHPLNDLLHLSVRAEDDEFGSMQSRQYELGARREFKRGDWVYGYGLRHLEEDWNVGGEQLRGTYLLPGVSVSQRRRRGSLVNPSEGFSQWYRLEGGASNLGSDTDVVRALANFGYIQTLGERHRIVLRSDLGAVLVPDGDRSSLAPSLNFFAGGSQSIRGFGYQSIGREISTVNDKGEEIHLVVGGERLATASVEYQYSFTSKWRGALFLDGGDAFDEGDFHLNFAAGFGIHYVTKVGALRLELADPLSEDNPDWRIHLAVGAEF